MAIAATARPLRGPRPGTLVEGVSSSRWFSSAVSTSCVEVHSFGSIVYSGGRLSYSALRLRSFCHELVISLPPEVAEHDWNKEEGRHCGNDEAADNGAAQGGVLLRAFTHPESHWHHTDDHR